MKNYLILIFLTTLVGCETKTVFVWTVDSVAAISLAIFFVLLFIYSWIVDGWMGRKLSKKRKKEYEYRIVHSLGNNLKFTPQLRIKGQTQWKYFEFYTGSLEPFFSRYSWAEEMIEKHKITSAKQ